MWFGLGGSADGLVFNETKARLRLIFISMMSFLLAMMSLQIANT